MKTIIFFILVIATTVSFASEQLVIGKSKDGNYLMYLPDTIDSRVSQPELLEAIKDLPKSSTLTIMLSGYGGSVAHGLQLMHALASTKAHVKIIVTSPAYSMHAIIACVSNDMTIQPQGLLMFHDYSITVEGKGNEILKNLQALNETLRGVMIATCVRHKVLTVEQVDQIFEGKDVYITSQGVMK